MRHFRRRGGLFGTHCVPSSRPSNHYSWLLALEMLMSDYVSLRDSNNMYILYDTYIILYYIIFYYIYIYNKKYNIIYIYYILFYYNIYILYYIKNYTILYYIICILIIYIFLSLSLSSLFLVTSRTTLRYNDPQAFDGLEHISLSRWRATVFVCFCVQYHEV